MNKLKKLEEIAKNETTKKLLPHILLFANDDKKIEEYCKEYLRILMDNDVFTREFIREEQTYLDLTFPPAFASAELFEKFFRSPNVKAKVRNCFIGLFVCRMKYWLKEDFNHVCFKKLMEYASDNASNMRFVFVIPEKDTDTELEKELYVNLNIATEYMELPDVISSEVYMRKQLMKQGIFVEEASEKNFRELVEKMVDTTTFAGYKTLDLAVQQLSLEALLRPENRMEPEVYSKVTELIARENNLKKRIGF